jgi:hypothetical protein
VNADKYMVMFRNQDAGQSHNIKNDDGSFERVEDFKYLGKNLKLQNSIQEEVKSILESGNACYHSMQHLFSSSLLSKHLKIKLYKSIILPVVLYGCESWWLALRELLRLRVSENTVLGRTFGPKRDEVKGKGKKTT